MSGGGCPSIVVLFSRCDGAHLQSTLAIAAEGSVVQCHPQLHRELRSVRLYHTLPPNTEEQQQQNIFETESPAVVQADLELTTILLSQIPKC